MKRKRERVYLFCYNLIVGKGIGKRRVFPNKRSSQATISMIHEILLALTGLSSSVIGSSVDRTFHPSEKQLLHQVHEFSKIVREVSLRVNESHKQLSRPAETSFQTAIFMITPAVVNVFDTLVLSPYLREISDIEESILTRNSKLLNGRSVIALSSLIACTVQSWQRRFEYSLSVLKYLEECLDRPSDFPANVFSIFQESIGYKGVDTIRIACVNAASKVWLQVMSTWVLYGHNPEVANRLFNQKQLVFLPLNLPESTVQLIYTTGGLMNQLSNDGSKSSVKVTTKLEILRESYLEKINDLQAPLHSFEVTNLITGIRREIILKTGSQHFSPTALTTVFRVLRYIVLFGDSMFAEEFSKELPKSITPGNVVLFPKFKSESLSNRLQRKLPLHQMISGAFERTLKTIQEDANCTDSQRETFTLAQPMLSIENAHRKQPLLLDNLLGIPVDLNMKLNSVQETILQTATNKKIYLELFSFFGSLRISMEYLSSLWSPYFLRQPGIDEAIWLTAHKAKIFADILWEFFQSFVIDTEFSLLFEELKRNETNSIVNPDEISQKHNAIIIKLYNKLLVKNERFANLMGDFMLEIKILHNTVTKTNSSSVLKVNALMQEIYACIEEIQLSDAATSKMGLHILLLRIEFVKEDLAFQA